MQRGLRVHGGAPKPRIELVIFEISGEGDVARSLGVQRLDRVVVPATDEHEPDLGELARREHERPMALALQVHPVDDADGQRDGLARGVDVHVRKAILETVVDHPEPVRRDADVSLDLADKVVGVGHQAGRASDRPARYPPAHTAALRSVADLGKARGVYASGDENGRLAHDRGHPHRSNRLPRGEPAEDDVAATQLPPKLQRSHPQPALVVVDDVEPLRERLAIDAGERGLAPVRVENRGHGRCESSQDRASPRNRPPLRCLAAA